MIRFLLFCLFVGLSVSAKAVIVTGDIKPTAYNDILKRHVKRTFQVEYYPKKKQLFLAVYGGITIDGIAISSSQTKKLIAAIEKYKEWNSKATQKKVKLQKNIDTINVIYYGHRIGRGEWSISGKSSFNVGFFSQTPQKHVMFFDFPRVSSITNKYDKWESKTIYFSWAEATKLYNAITPKGINAAMKKENEAKKLQDEFN